MVTSGSTTPKANKLMSNTAITLFAALTINVALIYFNAVTIIGHTHDVSNVPTLVFKDTGNTAKRHEILDHVSSYSKKLQLTQGSEINEDTISKPNKQLATATKKGRYAYTFVLGGIHEDEPAYKGFLYNILISVNLLNKLGSEADFWVWAQLSPNSTLNEIPEEEMRLFDAFNITVVKLEKPTFASFSSLMIDKFRALQKTQYKRIMYLDGDLIPLVNLDYYFHLSDPDEKSVPTILRPNINIATKRAPCNGGMFMMHPAVDAWEQLATAVDRQHDEGLKLPYPHFDKTGMGWGHDFKESNDKWESIQKNGRSWRFYGGHTDQGLWYYYSKYVRKDVSILIGDRLQTWVASGDDNDTLPVMVKEDIGILKKYSPKPLVYQFNCDSPDHNCSAQSVDVSYFMLKSKPWLVGTGSSWYRKDKSSNNLNAPTRLWFRELRELSDILNLGLDIDDWNNKHADIMHSPPLGFVTKPSENAKYIRVGKNL